MLSGIILNIKAHRRKRVIYFICIFTFCFLFSYYYAINDYYFNELFGNKYLSILIFITICYFLLALPIFQFHFKSLKDFEYIEKSLRGLIIGDYYPTWKYQLKGEDKVELKVIPSNRPYLYYEYKFYIFKKKKRNSKLEISIQLCDNVFRICREKNEYCLSLYFEKTMPTQAEILMIIGEFKKTVNDVE